MSHCMAKTVKSEKRLRFFKSKILDAQSQTVTNRRKLKKHQGKQWLQKAFSGEKRSKRDWFKKWKVCELTKEPPTSVAEAAGKMSGKPKHRRN